MFNKYRRYLSEEAYLTKKIIHNFQQILALVRHITIIQGVDSLIINPDKNTPRRSTPINSPGLTLQANPLPIAAPRLQAKEIHNLKNTKRRRNHQAYHYFIMNDCFIRYHLLSYLTQHLTELLEIQSSVSVFIREYDHLQHLTVTHALP